MANASYGSSATSVATGQHIEDIIYRFSGRKPDAKHGTLQNLYSDIYLSNKGVAIVDFRLSTTNQNGHAFIADGAHKINYKILHYTYDPIDKMYIPTVIKNEQSDLIHYNWGWGGNCNGWFNLNAVDPNSAKSYDYDNNYSNFEFNKDSIIYWFYKL